MGVVVALAVFVVALVAGCGSSTSSSTPTATPTATGTGLAKVGGSITVLYHYPAPPASMLDEFTKLTGTKVNWVQIGYDNEQTKIATAMTSNTYFADATDVDWSKVGEYYQTKWFEPLTQDFDIAALKSDVPQLDTFIHNGTLVAMPFDSSFTVTTWNTKLAGKAGITAMPTTLTQFTSDMNQIKSKGVLPNPLDIPFAAAEGLSTYWYQVTAAYGGQVLDSTYAPLFTSPSSAGYKAMTWMVNAYKSGLVPAGNIGQTDYGAFTSEMATGRVAAVFSDYSRERRVHLRRAVNLERGRPGQVPARTGRQRSGPERGESRRHRHSHDREEQGGRRDSSSSGSRRRRTRRSGPVSMGPRTSSAASLCPCASAACRCS